MTFKLYAFTCGTVTGEFARLMQGDAPLAVQMRALACRRQRRTLQPR